ncbi:MAG: restriction endonuclease subunit S [Syntrophus sp. (in: bacteria)]
MRAVEGTNRWQTKSLRDLATINYGRSPAAILAEDGLYPVVGTGGDERRGNDYLHEGESIILGRKGTIDRVYFATGRFWTIDTAYFLTDLTESVPKWLYYFLQTIDFRQMNEATGVPSLSRDLLYKIEIPTPPTPEQSKIAEILSTVDRAIEQTEALIAKQQSIKTGLMQDILTRGIDEHGNLRSERTHQFKDSPLGRIPVEWEVSELEAVAEFVTSGSRGWAQYYSADGAMFLRIGNLTRDHINLRLNDIVLVDPTKTSEGKRTSVSTGDLLISITADLGIIGVIPERFGEGYVNQHIALVRLLPAKVDARFIGWFLSGCGGQVQFEKLNESGAKAGLNLPTIRKLLVSIVKLAEQARIANVLDTNTNWVDDLYLRLGKLRSLKTALMQDLLTGKRRVTPMLRDAP